ncbi:MAG: agmatine deiminase family protein, partial [Planctomycetota bacterium]
MRFYGHLMNGVAVAIAALVLSSAAGAEQAKRVPRDILDGIVDDEPDPLPRHMTPAEQRLPLPLPATRGAAPSGAVDTPTEYEPNEGMLIRWGSYNALLTELTVGVTTGDAEAVVYILVTGASQQASATSTLTSAEADMSQVEFITYSSNSVWIRDYGPRFIFEDENRAIVDHTYNR